MRWAFAVEAGVHGPDEKKSPAITQPTEAAPAALDAHEYGPYDLTWNLHHGGVTRVSSSECREYQTRAALMKMNLA